MHHCRRARKNDLAGNKSREKNRAAGRVVLRDSGNKKQSRPRRKEIEVKPAARLDHRPIVASSVSNRFQGPVKPRFHRALFFTAESQRALRANTRALWFFLVIALGGLSFFLALDERFGVTTVFFPGFNWKESSRCGIADFSLSSLIFRRSRSFLFTLWDKF